MKRLLGLTGLALASSFALPLGAAQALDRIPSSGSDTPAWIARGGGGGRAGGGGGRAGGGGRLGGGGGGGGARANTGFSSAGGGLNRGDARPTGGWSSRVSNDRVAPSLDRSAGNRGSRDLGNSNLGNRNLGNRNLGGRDLGSRDVTRNVNRNVTRDVNRDWGRNINVSNVDLHPGWARPGWGVARPWNYGWYGVSTTPAWGWWGARAAAWGVGTLATAAIINNAVDNAVDSQASYIVVPNTDYQLLYGTVQPINSSGVSFDVTVNGGTYNLTADCKSGYLNGREPSSVQEAELLNAACQVAYGSA